MTTDAIVLVAYFFVLSILAMYGWHRYYLVYEYRRNAARVPGAPPPMPNPPVVTIQLPIYNEMYVVDRLIDAVCEIQYPRERLEIQVLDDSTSDVDVFDERSQEYFRPEFAHLGVQLCFQNGAVLGFNKPCRPLGRGENGRCCRFADDKLDSRRRDVVCRLD